MKGVLIWRHAAQQRETYTKRERGGGGGGSPAELQQTHARRMRTWETVKSDRDERHDELLFQGGPGNDGGSAVGNRANWGSEAPNA